MKSPQKPIPPRAQRLPHQPKSKTSHCVLLTFCDWYEYMCGFGFRVTIFFFFTRLREINVTVYALFIYCNSTVYTLKNIKNGYHSTIHTFKNYFTTVFSVFSFSNNKFNLNRPYDAHCHEPMASQERSQDYAWITFASPFDVLETLLQISLNR